MIKIEPKGDGTRSVMVGGEIPDLKAELYYVVQVVAEVISKDAAREVVSLALDDRRAGNLG